ncbi:MAG: chemotaxis response regulator protein-glutamate methylesterase [Nitrospirota bacterium]
MSEIKVLVVDDSAYSRQTIRKMLETEPNIRVIGVASNGIDAMFKTLKLKPDLITLDIEMPEMDGFTFLRWLMKERPTPVIMVSSYSDNRTVFKALELGAVDFIAKPTTKKASIELHGIKKDLLSKVRGIKSLRMDRLSKNLELLMKEGTLRVSSITQEGHNIEVIAVGASTGGPAAIQIILTRLPSDFSAGVVISQHMPRGFTASFAERLDKISGVRVKEAEEGDEVKKGTVLICPGGSHMSFRRRGQKIFTTIKESTQMDKYIPSVDTMMSSVSEHFGSRAMGVILTGMGSDGKVGMLEIKNRGGYTIAESEETAVVFGMPSEVINTGAAERILPISEIPAEIIRMTRR